MQSILDARIKSGRSSWDRQLAPVKTLLSGIVLILGSEPSTYSVCLAHQIATTPDNHIPGRAATCTQDRASTVESCHCRRLHSWGCNRSLGAHFRA